MKRSVMVLILGLSLGVVAYLGCGDDEGGKETVSGPCWSGACPDGWTTASGGEGCTYDGPTTSFAGELIEFSTDNTVEAARLQVYDNDTGNKIPVCADSGAGGAVSLSGIPASMAKIGIKVSKENYKDTYQFDLANGTTDETLWIVSEVLYAAAPTMAGVVIDPTKGVVAGALYFINEAEEEEEVGCATITSDKGGDIRYFGDTGMPTTIASRATTHPDNAYFLVGNVPEGKTKITAKVETTEIGSVSIFTFADSICINNIYATTSDNPEPVPCE